MSAESQRKLDESTYYQEHKDVSEIELYSLHRKLVALVAEESVKVGVTSAAGVVFFAPVVLLIPYYGMKLSSAIKRRETVERIFGERGIELPNIRVRDIGRGLFDGAVPVVRLVELGVNIAGLVPSS